ncbi:hypothetical protein F4815DRAFT_405527 [Daldinia loculata]|nr:hypothetical protein F4815DRAFT_405527 [Daldinia loculata]
MSLLMFPYPASVGIFFIIFSALALSLSIPTWCIYIGKQPLNLRHLSYELKARALRPSRFVHPFPCPLTSFNNYRDCIPLHRYLPRYLPTDVLEEAPKTNRHPTRISTGHITVHAQ